jgi:hypothetical protein
MELLLTASKFIPVSAVNLPCTNVSRTGYNEVDLTDNRVSIQKIDLSLHVRPFEMS